MKIKTNFQSRWYQKKREIGQPTIRTFLVRIEKQYIESKGAYYSIIADLGLAVNEDFGKYLQISASMTFTYIFV